MTSAEATDRLLCQFSQISLDSFLRFCQIVPTTAPQKRLRESHRCPEPLSCIRPVTVFHLRKKRKKETFSSDICNDGRFRERSQRWPHKLPQRGCQLIGSRGVLGSWHGFSSTSKTRRPSPGTINMSFRKPNRGCSVTACLPPSLPLHSLFQHIPLSTSFLPHPLNFNTCLSCFLLFPPPLHTSPLFNQTLAAYLVITRAL